MSIWSTARAIGTALGITERDLEPVVSALGRTVFDETKRGRLREPPDPILDPH